MLSLLFTEFADKNVHLLGTSREIIIDATLGERPTYSGKLTTNPIESGSLVNDHVIDDPDTLTLDCLVSDTQVKLISGAQDVIERGFGASPRSRSTFDLIRELRANRTLITIISGLTLYTDMIIVNFSPNKTSRTGRALRFTLQLQKIILVNSQVLPFSPATVSAGSSDQIQSTTNAGKQASKTPGATTQRDVSALRQIYNIGTGNS